MDIYKLLYTIIGFHLALSCVLFIMELPISSNNGLFTESGTQTTINNMLSNVNGTATSTVTDVNGTVIHDLCDPDNQNCDSDFETVVADPSIYDDIMRFVPGGKYVTKFGRFIKFVMLAPYQLVLDRIPSSVENVVIRWIVYLLFTLWHMVIAINLFNWIFNNRGKPTN